MKWIKLLETNFLPPKDHPQYQTHKNYSLGRFDFGISMASLMEKKYGSLKKLKILDIGIG